MRFGPMQGSNSHREWRIFSKHRVIDRLSGRRYSRRCGERWFQIPIPASTTDRAASQPDEGRGRTASIRRKRFGTRLAQGPTPTPPPSSTRSSSAPASPVSINSTGCASSACGSGSSNPAAGSAAPGTGTAIRARVSTRRAGPTATPSRRSCSRSGTGTSTSRPNPTPSAISTMSRTSSTCAATSSSTAASPLHSIVRTRADGSSSWRAARAIRLAFSSPRSACSRRP